MRGEVGEGRDQLGPVGDGGGARHTSLDVPRGDRDALARGPRFDRGALGFGAELLAIGAHPHVRDGGEGVGRVALCAATHATVLQSITGVVNAPASLRFWYSD